MSLHSASGAWVEKIKPVVLTLRIIVGAMACGVLAFVGVALVTRIGGNGPPNESLELLVPLAVGAAPLAYAISWLLPGLLAKNARRKIADGTFPSPQSPNAPLPALAQLGMPGQLASVYQTNTIIALALLEGAAFLNVTAYLLSGSWIALGAGVALVLFMLAQFPTTSRLVDWIGEQQRLVEAEKLLVR